MKSLRWFSRVPQWLGVGAIAVAGLSLYPTTSRADDSDASKTERRDRKATDDQQATQPTDALHRQQQQQQQERERERNRQNAQNTQNAQQNDPNRRTANFRGDQSGRDSDASTARDRDDYNNQSDAQRNEQNDRRDGRQANSRRDRDMTWQDGRPGQNQNQNQNQNQRQRFGVTWADDDDHWTIDEVARGSLAARAGLRADDEVISLNGRQVSSSRDFMRAINNGQRAALVVLRDGRRQTLWIGGKMQGYGQQYNQNQFAQNQYQQNQFQRSYSQDAGQWSSDAHAFLGVQLNDNYPNLAVVKQVIQNSPAQQAGLQPGDTITSVNGQRVSSPQELTDEVQQLQPGEAVQIQFSRPQMRSIQVRLGGRSADAAQASYQSSDQDRNRDRSREQNRSDSSDNSQQGSHDHDKSSSSDSQDKSHSNDD